MRGAQLPLLIELPMTLRIRIGGIEDGFFKAVAPHPLRGPPAKRTSAEQHRQKLKTMDMALGAHGPRHEDRCRDASLLRALTLGHHRQLTVPFAVTLPWELPGFAGTGPGIARAAIRTGNGLTG